MSVDRQPVRWWSYAPAVTAVAASAAAVSYWLPAITRIAPATRRPLGITGGESASSVWLTFDDGPHPRATERVLDILAEQRARAVFFLVGEQVRRWPGTAARIAAEGHVVGVHCDRHRSLLRLSPRQVTDDLDRAVETLGDAGLEVECYRPPYGVLSSAALVLAHRRGWPIWLWDCDGRDWQAGASPAAVSGRILESVQPSATVLLHDSPVYCRRRDWRLAPQALEAILDGLAVRGITVARGFEPAHPG